jgi:hypothetical protein
MGVGLSARLRLEAFPPCAWVIDPYMNAKWAKWPDGRVGWVPRKTKLDPALEIRWPRTQSESSPELDGRGVRLTAVWGYDLHSIELDAPTWPSILAGESTILDGGSYFYEGDEFVTEWSFGGGIDGRLEVQYARPGSGDWGAGFSGRLADVIVEPLPRSQKIEFLQSC